MTKFVMFGWSKTFCSFGHMHMNSWSCWWVVIFLTTLIQLQCEAHLRLICTSVWPTQINLMLGPLALRPLTNASAKIRLALHSALHSALMTQRVARRWQGKAQLTPGRGKMGALRQSYRWQWHITRWSEAAAWQRGNDDATVLRWKFKLRSQLLANKARGRIYTLRHC